MISKGELHELDSILELTRACGKHMRDNGIDQWDENYPDRDSLLNDLNTETLFAYRENSVILGKLLKSNLLRVLQFLTQNSNT